MAREMGVIADLQGGQNLLSNKDITLSWDGTTVKGTHLNEIHTSTEERNLLLSVSNLAGGTTEDYTQDILQTVNDIMGNYSKFNNTWILMMQQRKQSRALVTYILTDRVAVNQSVVK